MERERIKIVAVAVLTLAVLLGVGIGLKRYNDGVDSDVAAAQRNDPGMVDPLEQARRDRGPAPASVLWIGDSYTVGAGADTPSIQGYAAASCRLMKWSCQYDVQGGTGFIVDPKDEGVDKVINRLDNDAARFHPDTIVVDAGRNDHEFGLAQVKAEETAALDKLRDLFPKARVVLVSPFYTGSNDDPMPNGYAAYLKQEAQRLDAVVIDPNAEGWALLPRDEVHEDGVHPNTKGHATYADAFQKAFKKFELPATSAS